MMWKAVALIGLVASPAVADDALSRACAIARDQIEETLTLADRSVSRANSVRSAGYSAAISGNANALLKKTDDRVVKASERDAAAARESTAARLALLDQISPS